MSGGEAAASEPRQYQSNGHYFLYNARVIDRVDDALFEPQDWVARGKLVGEASGRGAAYFLQAGADEQWVLRHSRRGGGVAHLSDDAYIWLGLNRCRVFQEWHLLADLCRRGLPVPTPVAARVVRDGVIYRGDLITVCVPAARPLADWLSDQALSAAIWRTVGATIARFHRAGVYHHDLNARNILLDADGAITLIDFDKSRLRSPGRWREHNVVRLRRSLDKIARRQPGLHFDAADWAALRSGYDADGSAA